MVQPSVSSSPNRETPLAVRLWQRIRLALVLLAALLCFVLALPSLERFAQHSIYVYTFPYPVDGLEGTLLFEARLLHAGEPLYQPLRPDRFISAPYPPLHPVLLAWTETLPQHHIWANGRLLSLIPALLIALLLAAMVYRLGRMPLAAFAAGLLWLCFPTVQLWGTRIKPDLLALTFVAVGLWLVMGNFATNQRQSHGLALAAVAFALAFLTKQTAVLAAFASGLALLIDDIVRVWWPAYRLYRWPAIGTDPWRAVRFGLLYLGIVLGWWGLLDLVTTGQYTFHVWGLHRSEWWSWYLFSKFLALALEYWPLMVVAGLAVPLAVTGDRSLLLPACYGLVAPITMAGAGETGAHHNHLLEVQLALTLVSFTTLSRLWQFTSTPGWRSHLATGTLGIALLLVAIMLADMRRLPVWYRGEFEFDDPTFPARFVELIQSQPGEVLADNPALVLAAGKPLRYDDPSTMGPAARSGVWPQNGLIAEINARRFDLLLMPQNIESGESDHTGRWNDEVLAAMRANYRLLYEDRIKTYVRKD